MGKFNSFLRFSSQIFHRSEDFLANFCENSWVLGVYIVSIFLQLLAFLLLWAVINCCHPCCHCYWHYCCRLCHCCCLHPVCGMHSCCYWRILVPGGFLLLVSLLLLGFLVVLAFLLFLLNMLLLASCCYWLFCCWWCSWHSIPADPGIPILAWLYILDCTVYNETY